MTVQDTPRPGFSPASYFEWCWAALQWSSSGRASSRSTGSSSVASSGQLGEGITLKDHELHRNRRGNQSWLSSREEGEEGKTCEYEGKTLEEDEAGPWAHWRSTGYSVLPSLSISFSRLLDSVLMSEDSWTCWGLVVRVRRRECINLRSVDWGLTNEPWRRGSRWRQLTASWELALLWHKSRFRSGCS